MNGSLLQILLELAGVVAAAYAALINIVFRMYVKMADERHADVVKQLELLRQRSHDTLNGLAEVKAVMHMRKTDRE